MHGSRPACLLAALTASLACAAAPAAAAGPRNVVRGELLVRFDVGVAASERAAARQRADTPIERSLPLSGLQLVRVEPGDTTVAADARLERQSGVLYAEPNRFRSVSVTPNDPLFGDLWGLVNAGQTVRGTRGITDADIDADGAWDLTSGDGATVAVVDSGVDLAHPDLAPNKWTSTVETVNGADDDADGHVDDVAGWDWVDADNDPSDLNGHGTHVAGTIGARGGDAAGVAGVAWDANLMPLRILDANGSGTVADAIEAYEYAAAHGARVLNASFGGTGYSLAEHQAIQQLLRRPKVLCFAPSALAGNRTPLCHLARTHGLQTVLRRGIRVRVTCSEACLLGAKAVLRNRGARATRTGQISGRGTRTLAIRLGPQAKQRLRHVRRATVSITIRATDPAGNSRILRRVLRVQRGR